MSEIFTGTLMGPHGSKVGRWVKFEDHHNEVAALRGKLAECAKECAECGGTGCVPAPNNTTAPCPDCADIREFL